MGQVNADLDVGGGLPPIAECQPMHLVLTHRNLGQAPSHIWFYIGP